MTPFWHWFVVIITVLMIVACVWLLLANSRGVPGEVKDHVWDDDLREYNNPLPRWWFNLFIITIVFSVVYLVFYPGLGNLSGRLGWTSKAEMQTRLDAITASRRAVFASFAGKDVMTLAADPAAKSQGRALFIANCAGCHGADARGAVGYPNLTDNDWLYGDTPERIIESISKGRQGQMPFFNGTLSSEQMQALLDFVPYWSDPTLTVGKRAAGMKQFSQSCAACHGPDGKGNTMLGAPNLTDDIWLYGSGRRHLRETILWGRKGAMPAHETLLNPDEVRVVAAYVYGLSGANGADKAAPP